MSVHVIVCVVLCVVCVLVCMGVVNVWGCQGTVCGVCDCVWFRVCIVVCAAVWLCVWICLCVRGV